MAWTYGLACHALFALGVGSMIAGMARRSCVQRRDARRAGSRDHHAVVSGPKAGAMRGQKRSPQPFSRSAMFV